MRGLQQVAAADEAATVAAIKAAFLGLSDPNDWTGDGQPEGWKMIDRVYTKAEARYIPNGPNSTADMAHPTRTGDLVAFSYPPYQFDAATPGTLVALSAFFGQHGYVPDVQNLDANINMRATFMAGGQSIAKGGVARCRTIDLAPTAAFILGVPVPQHSQGRVLTEILRGGERYKTVTVIGLTDFHGQLEPTTTPIDGINVRRRRRGLPGDHVRRRMQPASRPEPAACLRRQRWRLAGQLGPAARTCPPSTWKTPGAWTPRRTATTSSTTASTGCYGSRARANFPFLGANIVDASDRSEPGLGAGHAVFDVNGVQVGVIGIELENTPELVSAGATAGLKFLPEAETIRTESERLRQMGVRVQIVLIHEGVGQRRQHRRRHARDPVGRADHHDRERHSGHHGRPDPCRAHAQDLEHDGRQDPGRRRPECRAPVTRWRR